MDVHRIIRLKPRKTDAARLPEATSGEQKPRQSLVEALTCTLSTIHNRDMLGLRTIAVRLHPQKPGN